MRGCEKFAPHTCFVACCSCLVKRMSAYSTRDAFEHP